jgi:hypothetical protein
MSTPITPNEGDTPMSTTHPATCLRCGSVRVYGKGLCFKHYPSWTPAPDDINAAIIERRDWPTDAKPDERVYTVECDRAMRPLMADDDTSPSTFVYDTDGEMTWVPVDADSDVMPTQTHGDSRGTYAMASGLANRLNALQNTPGAKVGWIYSPVQLPSMDVAA